MTAIKPWFELSRETIFSKYGHKLDKVIFELPDGTQTDFYLSGHNNRLVCVLPFTMDNQIIVQKQFRPGPQQVVYQLPGGGVEENELPLEAVKRELLEETGYIGDFELIIASVCGGYSGATSSHFVAKNCRKIQEIKNTNTEEIEVELVNLEKFKKYLLSGLMLDVDTGYQGLDHLKLLS